MEAVTDILAVRARAPRGLGEMVGASLGAASSGGWCGDPVRAERWTGD